MKGCDSVIAYLLLFLLPLCVVILVGSLFCIYLHSQLFSVILLLFIRCMVLIPLLIAGFCVRVLFSEWMNSRKLIYNLNLFIYELAK